MTKRILGSLFFSFFTLAVFSQTIVSTDSENRKGVLEVFTGIYCGFCPQGQQIARTIRDNNPGDFFFINIHQGGFANPQPGDPDFRTSFGNAIVNQSYSGAGFGYPSGTINRQNFPGREMTASGTTAMGRNFWTISANDAMAQASYVNVAAEATIDVQTNELSVHVEAYYTGDSPEATNKLNIALLQHNTRGPQSGGGQGNNYMHNNRLVHMVTGQWGADVTTTTTGTLYDNTFTYTIPDAYNGISAELADFEVVVFMAEGQQFIVSGNNAVPTLTNFQYTNDIRIREVLEVGDVCTDVISPVIKIQNMGSANLTSLEIQYSVNGGDVETFTWTGDLEPLQTEEVELPEIAFDLQVTNTLSVTIEDDQNNSNNTEEVIFNEAVEGSGTLTLTVQTDNWGGECTWNIRNSQGAIVANGGPYGNNQTYTISLALEADCYTFNLLDSYGDGGGPVNIVDENGTVIFSTGGAYGSGVSQNFSTDGELSTEDHQLVSIAMYPNPSKGTLNISTQVALDVEIYDVTGKRVFVQNNVTAETTMDVSALKSGVYFVKMKGENLEQVQRLVRN